MNKVIAAQQVTAQWGAVESVMTALISFVSSSGFMWWRMSKLEKKQDQQDVEDRKLNKYINDVKDEMKTMITELLIRHGEEQTKNFEKMVSMFSNTLVTSTKSSSEQTQSIINLTEKMMQSNAEFKDSIKHLHNRIDSSIEKMKDDFIHKDHCTSKMMLVQKEG